MNTYTPEEPEPQYDDEIAIIDLLLIVWKHRWVAAGVFFSVIVASWVIIGLKSSPRFTSKATILNMVDRGFAKVATDGQFAFRVNSSRNALLQSILNSSILAGKVLEKKKFLPQLFPRIWDGDTQQWVLKEGQKPPTVRTGAQKLKKVIKVSANDKGPTITISATTHSPQFSADIVNAYIEQLQLFLKENTFTAAKKNRLFLEEQLEKTGSVLDSANKALETFQKTHQIFNLSKQSNESIEAYSEKIRLLDKYRTELGLLKQISSESSPKIVNLKKKIALITNRINKLKTGINESGSNDNSGFLPINKLHYLKEEQSRLKKAIETARKQYDTFLEAHRKQVIKEAKNDIYITVLDKAVASQKRKGLKGKKIILLGGVAGIFLGIFSTFFLELFINLKREIKHRSKNGN